LRYFNIVTGEVIYENGRMNYEKLGAMSRLAHLTYAGTLGCSFLERPK
jgi:hypothetical protein